MKNFTFITAILLTVNLLSAQININDTSFYSEALQEIKMVDVFLPPGYNDNPDLYYPVIYILHGWGGNQNTGNTYMTSAYNLINSGTIDPVIMVCADNSTDPFDGSMYVNSILWGDYETFMTEDLPDWIESTYRAMPDRNYRGLFGQSMGGYGAFRYGILHKEKYRAITSHAGLINFLDEYVMAQWRQTILQATSGPPYYYDYNTSGFFTQGYFLLGGAFSPNYNTPQTYINPSIVEFGLDDNGNFIDTIVAKIEPHDIAHMINQLSPSDSLGIYFGDSSNDELFLYPGTLAVKDSLDIYDIPYGYYSHNGGHAMPGEFKINALAFLDSLLMPPAPMFISCLPEGITFTTQEEIDNFQTNYPNCNEIEGDVTIGEWLQGNIKNLNGLSVLSSFGGDLIILDNDSLTNLLGLENLTSIGGDLTIWQNDSLTSLTGLDNLTSIEGSCKIGGNQSLINLSGLEGLFSIGGDFEIGFQTGMVVWGNWSLTSIEGISNLTALGESLIIRGNTSLASLSGLENITSISGALWIDGNWALINLTGLDNLTSIVGDLWITHNTSLSSCEVQSICDYLAVPNGTIIISDNAPGCNNPEEVYDACWTHIEDNENTYFEISFSPNPVNEYATVVLSSISSGSINISLYNSTGICFKNWQFQNQQPGQKELFLDLKDLPAGVYFCRVQVGNETATKKIIKMK